MRRSMHARFARLCAGLVILAGLATGAPARAQAPAFLVEDIQTIGTPAGGSDPAEFVAVGSNVFFTADTPATGRELFVHDGVSTSLVADIRPGPSSSNPTQLCSVGGVLLFIADDGVSGLELWKSDGTEDGTTLLVDIEPGPASSNPAGLFVDEGLGLAFLVATSGATGREAWRSDGMPGGTFVLDVTPGPIGASPFPMLSANGRVYFTTGNKLYGTSGTMATTDLLLDPSPDVLNINSPSGSNAANGELWFSVQEPNAPFPLRNDLWKSGGTSGTTGLVHSFVAPANHTYLITDHRVEGGDVTFVLSDLVVSGCCSASGVGSQLWASNGMDLGTFAITPLVSGTYVGPRARLGANELFFQREAGQLRLYSTDGSAGTFALLHDFGPFVSLPRLVVDGSLLYATVYSAALGKELWESNGSSGGTVPHDLRVGSIGSDPESLTRSGTHVFFSADDGASGRELFAIGGGLSTPTLLKDIRTGAQGSDPNGLTDAGGVLFFEASDAIGGPEPYKSDGTTPGTVDVGNLAPDVTDDASPQGLVAFGGEVYFSADDGVGGRELWAADAATPGARLVKDLTPGPSGSEFSLLAAPSSIFIVQRETPTRVTLHASDGSELGTAALDSVDVPAPLQTLGYEALAGPATSSAPLVYFGVEYTDAGGVTTGAELYASDGTPGGAALVFGGPQNGLRVKAVVGEAGDAFFLTEPVDGDYATTPTELWHSSGDAATTQSLASIPTLAQRLILEGGAAYFALPIAGEIWRSNGSMPGTGAIETGIDALLEGPVAAGGSIYFTGLEIPDVKLWKTDGSLNARVALVATLGLPEHLTPVGARVFFTNSFGPSLWVSDGTVDGTDAVATFTTTPTDFAAVGDEVVFSACEAEGCEPWHSDGTAFGTLPLADVEPGAVGSAPAEFVSEGGFLYFAATTAPTGRELWALSTAFLLCGNGVVDPGEACDGEACCAANCAVAAPTVTCRAPADVCDAPELCDGLMATCPADAALPSGTLCRAAAGVCDVAETCDGASLACPVDAKSSSVCRVAADLCDTTETCDGVTDDCPADGVAPAGVVCRAAAGVCDLAETCTGSGPACPVDLLSTAVCRPATDLCDAADACDGLSPDCPADGFLAAGTECRAVAGVCDVAETCTGSGPACPVDLKSTAVCRPAVDVCDVADSCDGVGNACPADVFAQAGLTCRPSAGSCDVEETCTGLSAGCPADQVDVALCDDDNACNTEACVAASCVYTPVADGTTCDNADVCDGADACQAGFCTAVGPPLDCEDADVCTIDRCDAALGCQPSPIPGCDSSICTALIDFEVLAQPDAALHGNGTSYTEAGFTLTDQSLLIIPDNELETVGTFHPSFGESTGVFDHMPARLVLQTNNEMPFALCSLHATELDAYGAGPFEAIGFGEDGARIASFTLDDVRFEPELVDLTTSGFRNLDQVSWELASPDPGVFQADNLCICRSCVPEPPDLEAWWTGDGCSTVDKQDRHHGTPFGVLPCTGLARVGSGSLFIEANVWVDVVYSTAIDPAAGPYTLAMWIRPEAAAVSGYAPLVVIGTDFAFGLSDGEPFVETCVGGPCTVFTSGLGPAQATIWHFVAITIDDATGDLGFVFDGQSTLVAGAFSGVPPSAGPFRIGADVEGSIAAYFDGHVDEIMIFRRTLGLGELAEIRYAGPYGVCKVYVDVEIKGTGLGGVLSIQLGGVMIEVMTTPGMSAEEAARALADAANFDPAIASLGIEALASGPRLSVSGTPVTGLQSTDPGLAVTFAPGGGVPVPTGGLPATLVLSLGLLIVAFFAMGWVARLAGRS